MSRAFVPHGSNCGHWCAMSSKHAHHDAAASPLPFPPAPHIHIGCRGVVAARAALQRACRQLAEEAGLFITLHNFSFINIVGAVSLNATLS